MGVKIREIAGASKMTPSMQKLLDVIDALPAGEVLTARSLQTEAGVGMAMFTRNTNDLHMADRRLFIKHEGRSLYVYGKPKTIAKLKKELGL